MKEYTLFLKCKNCGNHLEIIKLTEDINTFIGSLFYGYIEDCKECNFTAIYDVVGYKLCKI